MAKQRVVYGPWPRGMNESDDPLMVRDDQLCSIVNMDVMDDGRLRARLGFQIMDDIEVDYLIGSIPKDTFTTTTYAIFKALTGTQFYHRNPSGSSTLTTFTSLPSSPSTYYSVLNYNGFTYYLNLTGNKSFRTALGVTTGAVTTLTNVPDGGGSSFKPISFIFKDRMWLLGSTGNRIYYSKVTDPTIWAAPDGGFFDVGPSDGDGINSISIVNDTIYIFKTNTTWAFRFTEDPATDGYLDIIADKKGAYSSIVYNNRIYTMDATSVYAFSNGVFEDIASDVNIAVSLLANFPSGNLVAVNDKLYALGGDVYVMNLRNGAWSKYQVVLSVGGNGTQLNFSSSNVAFASHSEAYENQMYLDDGTDVYIHRPSMGFDANSYFLDKIKLDGISYWSVPTKTIVSKRFSFDDRSVWKRCISLFADGLAPIEDITGEHLYEFGYWAVTLDRSYGNGGTFDISDTATNFGRIPINSFRFKEFQLEWLMGEQEPLAELGIYDDAAVPSLKYPQLHNVVMNISRSGAEISK